MKQHWKPILTLLFLSPTLTELLTTSTPLATFIQPGNLIFLTTLGYGFPVLIIRELYIRKKLDIIGLFILGIAYGLYNEGLLARTIFDPFHSPIDLFATYGLVDHIRIPWMLTITLWHAFYAVIFPITITHFLFPEYKNDPWLSKTSSWIFGILCLSLGSTLFMSDKVGGMKGYPGHLLFLILTGSFLFALGLRRKKTVEQQEAAPTVFRTTFLLMGLLIYFLLFLIPLLIAKATLFPLFFVLYLALATHFVTKKVFPYLGAPSIAAILIAIGAMVPVALFTILITLPFGSYGQAISSGVFILSFIYVAYTLRQKSAHTAGQPEGA